MDAQGARVRERQGAPVTSTRLDARSRSTTPGARAGATHCVSRGAASRAAIGREGALGTSSRPSSVSATTTRMSAPPRSSLDAAPRWPIGSRRGCEREAHARLGEGDAGFVVAHLHRGRPFVARRRLALDEREETNAASCGGETPKRHAGPAPSRSAAFARDVHDGAALRDRTRRERAHLGADDDSKSAEFENARPRRRERPSDVHPGGRRRLARHGRPTHARRGTHAVRGGDASADERERFGAGAHTSATPPDAAADARDDDVAETTLRPPRRESSARDGDCRAPANARRGGVRGEHRHAPRVRAANSSAVYRRG